LLLTGELGNVTEAAAPQFGFATSVGVVVVVVEPALAGGWIVDIAQAATWAVPPTVLNRMTSPSSAAAKQTKGATISSTILFTTTLTLQRKSSAAPEVESNHFWPSKASDIWREAQRSRQLALSAGQVEVINNR
jgi:hypothetical protein